MIPTPKPSAMMSVVIHAAVIAILVLFSGVVKSPLRDARLDTLVLPSDLVKYQVTHVARAGGGGGMREKTPPTKGVPPKPSLRPLIPPTTKIPDFNPVLVVEQAILADPSQQIPQIMGAIGDPRGVLDVIGSNGPGRGSGIGTACCGGVGDKNGPGYGDKSGPGVGDTSQGFRDDTTQPRLVSKVEPIYSDEARKVKLQGSVYLRIVVNERGRAESIVVTQSLGLGLDERAIEAVKQWKFLPGMRAGRPVPTTAIVQVTFRLL